MRRLTLALILVLAAFATGSCSRKKNPEPASSAAALQSVIAMNDPAVAGQLVSGFHGVEGGSWRWTAKNFSMLLKPPAGSAQNGARLDFKFSLPNDVFMKTGAIQLTASIAGMPLGSEKYAKAGSYDYTRDVPMNLLSEPSVRIDFSCDKALEPSGGDVRELALVATSASLEPKTAGPSDAPSSSVAPR